MHCGSARPAGPTYAPCAAWLRRSRRRCWHAGLGGALLSAAAGGARFGGAGQGGPRRARTWPLAGAGGASGASAGTTARRVPAAWPVGVCSASRSRASLCWGACSRSASGPVASRSAPAGILAASPPGPASRWAAVRAPLLASAARAGRPDRPERDIRAPRARPVRDASREFSPEQAPPRPSRRRAPPPRASASPSAAEREFAP